MAMNLTDQSGASRRFRRRARGRCPAPLTESRPCGLDPSRLRSHFVPDLRAALAHDAAVGCVWAGFLFPSPYHGVLAVKVCAHAVRLRPGGRL